MTNQSETAAPLRQLLPGITMNIDSGQRRNGTCRLAVSFVQAEVRRLVQAVLSDAYSTAHDAAVAHGDRAEVGRRWHCGLRQTAAAPHNVLAALLRRFELPPPPIDQVEPTTLLPPPSPPPVTIRGKSVHNSEVAKAHWTLPRLQLLQQTRNDSVTLGLFFETSCPPGRQSCQDDGWGRMLRLRSTLTLRVWLPVLADDGVPRALADRPPVALSLSVRAAPTTAHAQPSRGDAKQPIHSQNAGGLLWNLTVFGNACPDRAIPGYTPPGGSGNACQDIEGEGLGLGALLAYADASPHKLILGAELLTTTPVITGAAEAPSTPRVLLALRNLTAPPLASEKNGCHEHRRQRRRELQEVYSVGGLIGNPFISRLDVFLEFSLRHPAIRIVVALSNPFRELGLVISQLVFPIFNANSASKQPVTMGFLATPIVLAPGAANQSSTIVVRVTDPDVINAKPAPVLDIRHGSFTVQLGEIRSAVGGGPMLIGSNSLKIVQFFSLEDMTRTKHKGHC
eukprot:COSAG05_NODE_3899_length_1782_cov_1.786096_1_plen_509_part_10